jgi:hypothetical protein
VGLPLDPAEPLPVVPSLPEGFGLVLSYDRGVLLVLLPLPVELGSLPVVLPAPVDPALLPVPAEPDPPYVDPLPVLPEP